MKRKEGQYKVSLNLERWRIIRARTRGAAARRYARKLGIQLRTERGWFRGVCIEFLRYVGVMVAVVALGAVLCSAAELSIAPPGKPIQPGWCTRLAVVGLTPADLAKCVVVCGPAGATADLLAPIGGDPFLHFAADKAGTFCVAIVCDKRKSQVDVTVGSGGPTPPNPPDPSPVNPWKPATFYQAGVKTSLTPFRLSPADSTALANLHGDLSKAVLRDDAGLNLTGELRAELIRRGGALGLRDTYPGLGSALDTLTIDAFGSENRPLNRGEWNAYLETIAWALWEARQ